RTQDRAISQMTSDATHQNSQATLNISETMVSAKTNNTNNAGCCHFGISLVHSWAAIMTPIASSGANKIGVWLANIAIPTIITRTIAVLIRCHILIEPYITKNVWSKSSITALYNSPLNRINAN